MHPLQSRRIWHRPEFVLPSLWILAFLMSTPMLAFSTVTTGFSIDGRRICTESTSAQHNLHRFKYIYGVFTVIFQYFLPFTILVAAYIRICSRMKQLARVRSKLTQNSQPLSSEYEGNTQLNNPRLYIEGESNIITSNFPTKAFIQRRRSQLERRNIRKHRERRTNIVLTCVTLMFAISWLPLNVVNIILDYKELQTSHNHNVISLSNQSLHLQPNETTVNDTHVNQSSRNEVIFMSVRSITLIQSFCLLCVLLSCCVNPVLYGYFNDNFQNEFKEILCCKRLRKTSLWKRFA